MEAIIDKSDPNSTEGSKTNSERLQEPRRSRFGQLLHYYRKKRHISQIELSELLFKVGFPIHSTAINKYELGMRRPSGGFIYIVAQVLNLSKLEAMALVDAAIADNQLKLMAEYLEAASHDDSDQIKE